MKRAKYDPIYPFDEDEAQVPIPPFVDAGSGLEVSGLSISVKTAQPLEKTSDTGAVTLKTDVPLTVNASNGGLGLNIGRGLSLEGDQLTSSGVSNAQSPLTINSGEVSLNISQGLAVSQGSLAVKANNPLIFTDSALSLNTGPGLLIDGSSLSLNIGTGLEFTSNGTLQLSNISTMSKSQIVYDTLFLPINDEVGNTWNWYLNSTAKFFELWLETSTIEGAGRNTVSFSSSSFSVLPDNFMIALITSEKVYGVSVTNGENKIILNFSSPLPNGKTVISSSIVRFQIPVSSVVGTQSEEKK